MDHDDRGWTRRDAESSRRFPPRLSADERERRDRYRDDPDVRGRDREDYGRPYDAYGRGDVERDPRRDVYEPRRETPGDRERWGPREERGWASRRDDAWPYHEYGADRPYRDEFGGPWARDEFHRRTYRDEFAGRPDRDEFGRGRSRDADDDPRAHREEHGFAGLGPSRYRRSDEKIYDDLNDRLTDHPMIDATDMEVFVEEGIVTLKGFVRSRQQKRLAEDVAEFASGVREVRNELRVGNAPRDARASAVRPADEQTATANASRLAVDMEVIDANGDRVGSIKAVHGDTFHLDRPMKRDLFVPLRAVREIAEGRAVLQYRGEDLDEMGWESPELLGMGTKRR